MARMVRMARMATMARMARMVRMVRMARMARMARAARMARETMIMPRGYLFCQHNVCIAKFPGTAWGGEWENSPVISRDSQSLY
jgi:hypothetical protein